VTYKKPKAGTERWWNEKIEKGILKARPQSGHCMFCGKLYDGDDSVCQPCWNIRLKKERN